MIVRQVRYLMDPWAAKGGPQSRRIQRQRAEKFALWCQKRGIRDLRQVGKRQVIGFLRELETSGRSAKTIQGHWYALRALFRLAELPEPVRFISEADKSKSAS
ncbi:MAG: hypothetical protein D6816_18645 [Bacteroidetes bacterium]|nr:MAG: hypothetical protein D6816_18645 [Bacteroidota bacterium]